MSEPEGLKVRESEKEADASKLAFPFSFPPELQPNTKIRETKNPP